MIKKVFAIGAVILGAALSASPSGWAQEYISGMKWNEPVVVTPGKTNADPPSDAIILFDGKDLSAWKNGENWTVKDGVATVGKGDITTKQSFGDCQLHIEWSAPTPAKGHGQQRGNSGVFLMDQYEVQVLDSYKDKTYFDGQASAIYKQRPPMVNATRPPGEWNTYEIVWDAPKFKDDGSLEAPAYVTVIHNGVLTQNHTALEGITDFPQVPHYTKHGKMPIHLQDHRNPVHYRNIWVREIKPIEGTREREPYFHDHATGKDTPVDKNKYKKTSSIQNGRRPDIEALAVDSTINLGMGTPQFPGQRSGQGQLRLSTNLLGPAVPVFVNGPSATLSHDPPPQPELIFIGNSGGTLRFDTPQDKKASPKK